MSALVIYEMAEINSGRQRPDNLTLFLVVYKLTASALCIATKGGVILIYFFKEDASCQFVQTILTARITCLCFNINRRRVAAVCTLPSRLITLVILGYYL